jgi:DnaJ homolog subfamily C member 9
LDVIAAYIDFEGDMNGLFTTVMLSNALDDEERYRKWIDEEIEAGRVEAYDAYTKESKKSKKARMDNFRNEGKAAMEYAKEMGVYDKLFGDNDKNGTKETNGKKAESDTSGLAALIQQRQKARANNFLADLEEKYASKQKNGKKRRRVEEPIEEVEEPPEEMFQKNRVTMEKSKAKKVKSTEELKPTGVRKSKRTKR